MQFNLFDDDSLESALEQDSRLYRGEYFSLESSKTAFINKRDGVIIIAKRLDANGRLHEIHHPITRFPILPVEVLRWDENVFFVHLVYSNKESTPMECYVRLDAIKKPGMPELRKALAQEGVSLNSMESTRLARLLLDVLRVGSAEGTIPVRNRVSRREWLINGSFLEKRHKVAPLSLVHTEAIAAH